MSPLHRVLVARALAPATDRPMAYAQMLARCLGAEVSVVHVQVPAVGLLRDPGEDPTPEALQQQVAERVEEWGGDRVSRVEVVEDASVASGIIRHAAALGADLIVMGTHGYRGLKEALLGSITESVVRGAVCAVLTVADEPEQAAELPTLQALLVPLDLSTTAHDVLVLAKHLATACGARLHLLHVSEARYQSPFDGAAAQAREEMRQQELHASMRALYRAAEGPEADEVTVEVRSGPVAYEIVEYAREHGASMILMATHGLKRLGNLLLGSVAERVVRTAPCPVLTINGAAQAPTGFEPGEGDAAG